MYHYSSLVDSSCHVSIIPSLSIVDVLDAHCTG